jgi:hypothetical protein
VTWLHVCAGGSPADDRIRRRAGLEPAIASATQRWPGHALRRDAFATCGSRARGPRRRSPLAVTAIVAVEARVRAEAFVVGLIGSSVAEDAAATAAVWPRPHIGSVCLAGQRRVSCALAGIVGAGRSCTARMISLLSMPRR